MILYDEAGNQTTVETATVAAAKAGDGESDVDSGRKQSAREEVEEWLDAVALCFGLPEDRRWIDF